jgi:hypothetical protein
MWIRVNYENRGYNPLKYGKKGWNSFAKESCSTGCNLCFEKF